MSSRSRKRAMKLTVVGCGDAFGSGGRLQTCYHVETSQTRFIIDCGATTLIGFNKLGIDPNTVETIFISHLHGDHFAGLVWWLVHAQHVAKRTSPLTVVGPEGVQARFETAAEVLFPGSTGIQRRYANRKKRVSHHNKRSAAAVPIDGLEKYSKRFAATDHCRAVLVRCCRPDGQRKSLQPGSTGTADLRNR